jgi:N-acetylmuramoyl-L-alanine amidase
MLPIIGLSSPNRDDRPDHAGIRLLVLHYTGMQSGQEAIDRLCDREAKVSSHYVVEEDGRIFRLVDEEDRAWHAGKSAWGGYQGVNDISIGIEIVNPGHEWGYRPFPAEQMQSVAALAQDIMKRHGILGRHVLGHSDVAPERKEDPGELFDWPWLASQGVGLWHGVAPQASSPLLYEKGVEAPAIKLWQEQMQHFGYALPASGAFDDASAAVARAFQRHFRPHRLDGVWDEECQQCLVALLTMAGKPA